MVSVELDMIQTAGIGALALMVGMVLTREVKLLQKYCIPSPVSGGIIFSLLTLLLYNLFHVEVSFDGTMKDLFMLAFFTSVGFQSDLKVLKQGGKALVLMLVLLVLIITLQNLMPLGITKLMGVNQLVGIATCRRFCWCTERYGFGGRRYHRNGRCYLWSDCRFDDRRTYGRIYYP